MAKVPIILLMDVDMSGDIHQPLTSVLSIDDDEMVTLLCDKTTISGRLERRQKKWQRYLHLG